MGSIVAKAPPLATVRTDLLAGLVVGIIAFPLSIALAVAVGVPPIAGLYTAVIAGAVAAVFGGSNFNITGPTAALVPVLSHAVLAHGPKALPTLGLLAGIMLVVLSILRAGRLVRYIPGTVVIGFTAGIALSIAFGQLNNLFNITGTDASLEHFHERTWDSIRHISSLRLDAPALAVPMLVLLFAWKRLPRVSAVPGPLVAVVLGIALDGAFHLDIPTVSTLYGDVPSDMPTPSLAFFEFELAVELLPLAFSVAVLAGIESLLSAVVADGKIGRASVRERV